MDYDHRGKSIAGLLIDGLRADEPTIRSDLRNNPTQFAPFLLETGAGGLLWAAAERWFGSQKVPDEWRQAGRLHALQAAVHEDNLRRLVPGLGAGDIDVLFIKGWSVARLYPRPEMRPYGDIDIAVAPHHFRRAHYLLQRNDGQFGPLDLHSAVPDLADRPWRQLWSRRRTARLEKVNVNLLGHEDQLRLHCLHLVRHGAWRPLWLCDIRVLLETAPADFDWDYCLRGKARLAQWVLATIGAAMRLLDAPVAPTDIQRSALHHSARLAPAILRSWSSGRIGDSHSRDSRAICAYLLKPQQMLGAVMRRWPGAIEAMVSSRACPQTRLPVWFFQALAVCDRALALVPRLLRDFPRRNRPLPASLSIHSQTLR